MIVDALTDVQKRLLMFMDEFGPKWFSLLELESVNLLEDDDIVTVPSLIEDGLVMQLKALKSIALTASGSVIAAELRDADYIARQRG
jgi:hypothetical protein